MSAPREQAVALERGQVVRIGEVRVVLRELDAGEVRLSIAAPRHVVVLRDELLRRGRPRGQG